MLAPKEYIPFKSLFNLQERKYKYTKAMNSQENPNVVLIILEPHPRAKVKGLHNCRYPTRHSASQSKATNPSTTCANKSTKSCSNSTPPSACSSTRRR